MMRKHEFLVSFESPKPATVSEMKKFVTDAMQSWHGRYNIKHIYELNIFTLKVKNNIKRTLPGIK